MRDEACNDFDGFATLHKVAQHVEHTGRGGRRHIADGEKGWWVDCGVKGVQVDSSQGGRAQFGGCEELSTVETVNCHSLQSTV